MQIIKVQNQNRFIWKGIPFQERYSTSMEVEKDLVRAIRKIDDLLDIKFYMPTQKWHLIRFYAGRDKPNVFIRVWELDDLPDLGLRKEPGFWMVDALKQADTWGYSQDRIKEIDKHNAEIEEKNERAWADIRKDLALELRKPLIHLEEFGVNSSYKGVF